MKKMTLLKTSVFAAAAVGFCVLASVAQDTAGYATLSGRPNRPTYAQRQVAAQKAAYNPAQAEASIARTSFTSQGAGCTSAPIWGGVNTGCGSTGCAAAPAAPASSVGCGESVGTGCGCNSAVPFPTGNCAKGSCSTGGCATGGCATGGCATGGCATGGCAPMTGSASGWASTRMPRNASCPPSRPLRDRMQRQRRQPKRQQLAMAAPCGPSYGAGYNKRMGRLLGGRRNQSCNTAGGGGGFGGCGTGSGAGGSFWNQSSRAYQSRNARLSQHLFGWLVPAGNGGQGSPPFGKYHTTYAQDANYFDQRDGQLYGAQGYGTHITVPLAPNVRHAYNYGWGLPSSRITRVSNVAPYTTLRPLNW